MWQYLGQGASGNGGGRRRGGRCRCQVGTHRKTRRRGQTIVGTEEYRSHSEGWCLGGTWSYFMGMIWACILFGEWPSEMKGWLLYIWRMVCCGWEACRSPIDDLDVGERERYPRDHVLIGFIHIDQFVSSNFSVQFSSVTLSCLTLCDLMNCNTLGFPVHCQLPEPTQTHVHHIGDAIQSSHPLLSPYPPTFNLSKHHGLFKWVSSSHQVAKVLGFQLQHQSFQWTPRTDFL